MNKALTLLLPYSCNEHDNSNVDMYDVSTYVYW